METKKADQDPKQEKENQGKIKKYPTPVLVVALIALAAFLYWLIESGIIWLLLIAAVIIGIIYAIWYSNQPECPECKKRKSTLISKTSTGFENITISKQEEIKHYRKDQLSGSTVLFKEVNNPDSVSIRDVNVAGVREHFIAEYSCKVCGAVFTRQEYQDREA